MSPPVTLLLIEDDLTMLEGISDLLEVANMGYEVTLFRASNGLEGLQVVREHLPDLVISDISMPKMNGYEFLEKLRQQPEWVHIPLIFLTAKGEQRDIMRGRLSGAEQYVTKPFDPDDFVSLVRSQLDRTLQLSAARERGLKQLRQSILQVLHHEFRTPLTYVTAYYEMLAEGLNQLEQQVTLQEYLRGIQAGSQRLAHLVNELIALIELRTEEMTLRFNQTARPVEDLAGLVRRVGAAREADARELGIAIQYELPASLPPVYGVEVMLARMFAHLLDNALKFTAYRHDDRGLVRLSARAEQDEVLLAVADNGIGFPEQEKDKIFDMFYQYNRAAYEQQGAGIGLTLVKGYASLHGGQVSATSVENAGSTFTVRLPLFQGRPPKPHETGQLFNKEAIILIVEDDPFLLEGLRELIDLSPGKFLYRTYTARNGMEALSRLEQIVPDLIISDIMMPEIDGYALLEQVRANPAWVSIPFIFLTARGSRQDLYQGRRSGAEEYITKPYDSNQLLALIEAQLTRYHQVRAAVSRDFNAFKSSILGLLQPSLRLPLMSVSTHSEQIAQQLSQVETEPELKESLHGLQAASRQLSRLVDDFISLAEIRTGEAQNAYSYRAAPLERADLLLAEAGNRLAKAANGHDWQVNLAQVQPVPAILADAESLLCSLDRLVNAAALLCRQSPQQDLLLASGCDETTVWFSVRSAGLCVKPREEAQIHVLFRGEDDSLINSAEYGPALAVAKGLIELHQGEITFANEGENGCTFTVRLPRYRPPAEGSNAA